MSGPTGHWSPEEDDLLHELSWAAQLIYLRGLRRFVDASTGIVGVRRRISRRSLIELLTVPDARGRHTAHEKAPTESAIRQALRALVACGLIVPESQDAQLVFRLPYALQGQSVRRMSDRMSDPVSDRMSDRGRDPISDRMSDRPEPHSYAAFDGISDRMSDRGRDPISDRMSDPVSDRMSDRHQREAIPLGQLSSACRPISRARATMTVVELCRALRLDVGMIDANPHRPELIQAHADGLAEAVIDTARELKQTRRTTPNVGYVVATVRGRIRDQQELGGVGNAVGGRARASVCEQIEEQDREVSALERRASLRVVD